ncbi:MAG TPA: zinc ribbon domain-containing protein [Candidatus Nanoarchaeia archaeon]|nr:zinc ribbon domain-containing protein [Candidatus Nanoarchaeia archaeon]
MKNVYSKSLQVENDNLECSSCGRIQKIKLSERIYNCFCGLILDRDENAAKNIIKYGRLGISLNGEETNTQSNEQVSSMKLEAYPFNGG